MNLAFPMPHMLRLKAMTQPWEAAVTGADQVGLAKLAEELGYGMIAVPEHYVVPRTHTELSGPHYFSAATAMAYWAGATEKIRVNSSIAILPLQNPIITAKTLSTMDWLSSGRVTITFGVGWLEGEFDALGVDYRKRGAISEEYIQAIIELWTSENPEFEGKYVSFRDIAFEPKCVQMPHLPVWFGGDADAVLQRTARYASGWWPFLTRPEDIPERIEFIKSQPDYNGCLTDVFYGLATARVGEGHVAQKDSNARPGMSGQEIIDRLSWLEELGVSWSSVPIPAVRDIEEYREYARWIAEDIMPAVQ